MTRDNKMDAQKEKEIWEKKLQDKFHEEILTLVSMYSSFDIKISPQESFSRALEFAALMKEYRKKNNYLEGYKRS